MKNTAVAVISLFAFLATTTGCSDEPKPPFEFFDACDPALAPDVSCYADKRDPTSADVALATDIAHRYIDEHPAETMAWNWEEGVLMYAMTELYRVTGDTAIRDYYKAYIDHHIAEGYGISVSDSCPPAIAAIALYQETGEQKYKDIIDEVLLYLFELAARTEEGGINHLGALEGLVTLWVDSLFMFGMPLTRWGELEGDRQSLDEMSDQLDIFATTMQNPNGLFTHAYNWPLDQDPDIYWARGNSWITPATADYLRARALRYETDERAEQILTDQITGIIDSQDASGGWWTVMNRPGETYLETSGSAFFAYGMARAYRYGFAGEEVRGPVADALAWVKTMIVPDAMDRPVVTGISGPTTAGDFDNYAMVEVEDDISYGVGSVILLLIESSGLP